MQFINLVNNAFLHISVGNLCKKFAFGGPVNQFMQSFGQPHRLQEKAICRSRQIYYEHALHLNLKCEDSAEDEKKSAIQYLRSHQTKKVNQFFSEM